MNTLTIVLLLAVLALAWLWYTANEENKKLLREKQAEQANKKFELRIDTRGWEGELKVRGYVGTPDEVNLTVPIAGVKSGGRTIGPLFSKNELTSASLPSK